MSPEEKKLAMEYPTRVPVQYKATDGSGDVNYQWQHVQLQHCTNEQLLNMDIDDYCGMTKKVAEFAGIAGDKVKGKLTIGKPEKLRALEEYFPVFFIWINLSFCSSLL